MKKFVSRFNWKLLTDDLHWILPLIIISATVVYGAAFLGITLCPLKSLIGLPCPLCGGTRASILFMKLKFIDAFKMSPVIYLLGLFILIWAYSRYINNLGKIVRYSFYIMIFMILAIYAFGMLTEFPNIEPYVPTTDSLLNRFLIHCRI